MTPLERAARAVREEAGAYAHPSGGFMTEGGIVDEQHFRDIVRAVLQAIREPSEGMERAGYGNSKGDPDNAGVIDNPAPIMAWQAMIDAALEEG
jgi:hypothetical protein